MLSQSGWPEWHPKQAVLLRAGCTLMESSMSKSTFNSATRASAETPRAGIFGRFFAALSKARQLQADREVEIYLARQPDRVLHDIGMSDADIQELRQRHDR
jgi:uncharacterized protein YjiS (DUF1127 family)